MSQNNSVVQNMIHVNDALVRIFKLLLVAVAAVVILKAAGFIELPWLYTIIVLAAVIFVCMVPIACRHFRMDAAVVKNVNIYSTAILCICGYCYLGMGLIVLLAVPIGFACMYFDMKLVRASAVLSMLGFILEVAAGRLIDGRLAAFLESGRIIIAVDAAQILIIATLLAVISRNVLKMLSSTHSFYENINSLLSGIQGSSQSLDAAEDVILQGVSSLASGIEKNDEPAAAAEEADSSNAKVRDIISNINRSMENAKDLIRYTQTMLKGRGKDLKAGDEAARLEEYCRNTKELVSKLSGYTDRIKEDLGLIAVMIDESKLLSVNAAAEAENAGSKGRGSVIVAMKVEKLADEAAESAVHIRELLNNVVNDAENTVKSVSQAYEEIFKSLELINRSVETLIKWLMYKNLN
ncbi:MAG TPA: methyl-accepting chemotaxis protein [Clostridia bacterium]|nr:methyl-accepting chemotaxis protein [Clostridia bacterium]